MIGSLMEKEVSFCESEQELTLLRPFHGAINYGLMGSMWVGLCLSLSGYLISATGAEK